MKVNMFIKKMTIDYSKCEGNPEPCKMMMTLMVAVDP
jgi:hypothetical protein